MTKIAIIQRVLPHYRVPFFLKLHKKLMHEGIDLELFYGQEFSGTVPKSVTIDVPWAYYINNKYLKFNKLEIIWQPCLNKLGDSDLIIVENANRLLLNYLLISRLFTLKSLLAYWGHGKNMQAKNSAAFNEWFKRILLGKVDWWFAYTSISADVVASQGFSQAKITNVQNSIDSKSFVKSIDAVNNDQIDVIRKYHGFNNDDAVCIYCGGLYDEKKIKLLLEACELISNNVSNFQMFIIGDGPDRTMVENKAKNHPWLHYVGALYGTERAVYFKMAKALLIPGAVGLAVIDSFVSSSPLFTTNISTHGPEIAYLKHGLNGFVTECSPSAYATAVSAYLLNEREQEKLMRGCAKSAEEYSIESMVDNFASGILKCLSSR